MINGTTKTSLNVHIVIGFAAACTAGILLPLDWMMGIRLAKEDEVEGLDMAGKSRSPRTEETKV